MSYKTSSTSTSPETTTDTKNGNVTIGAGEFDPEKLNTVGFSLYTDNTPGNVYISFSFKNDFEVGGKMGEIRIDDFTPYKLENGKRAYQIETNLLQIYTYALSKKVSNLTINIPEEKNSFVSNIYLK